MGASLDVPKFLASKDKLELVLALLRLQSKLNMRVEILSIYFDSSKKEHVIWYRDKSSMGSGF